LLEFAELSVADRACLAKLKQQIAAKNV
jgi:hypothetical protein